MRNALPVLLILIAAAVGVWLLLGADDEPANPDYDVADGSTSGTEGSLKAEAPETEGLSVKGKVPSKRRPPPVAIADPRTLPKGVLLVTMLGPDLKPLESESLRVYVEPLSGAAWNTKLPTSYDKAARTHRFERVVAGPVSVRIQGDHVVARTVKTTVKRDRENAFSVPLDLAGAVRYDVIAYDKTRPDPVQLTLLDYRKQPVLAWYQERTSRRMTTPKQYRTATIGPEGVVFGVLPGRYVLRVVSPNDEWDEAKLDIVAGKTVKASLEVRR